MERMTLREAAERTSLSVTTLRRYIRSGRLNAEKRYGRFGPEYFVSEQDLLEAGLGGEPHEGDGSDLRSTTLAPLDSGLPQRGAAAPPTPTGTAIPLSMYQELQMKHEQLLVQYGMVRAGGLRVMQLQSELEEQQGEAERVRVDYERRVDRLRGEVRRLEGELREARFELEGRSLEISALQAKVKGLEMLTRNATRNSSIQQQFDAVVKQSRRVSQLSGVEPPDGRPKARWRVRELPRGDA